ncbi:MAG: hypothetical protein D8M58_18665 [Calditrichaeota bacterium]|nr:MAG: hypothetical protein DWQ03_21345 [Calditrichota bacterium]MBL1207433.1 hypothetical protein [Calditrichota bacterium]NOG47265.1 hypothetical protein [Calditrichota bacterium]
MKSLIIIISSLFATTVFAQNIDTEGFGFGGPEFMHTHIAGQNAFIVGGKGGKLINENFAIGGGGYALANSIDKLNNSVNGTNVDLAYGGVVFSYFTKPISDFNFSGSVLIGGGGLSYKTDDKLETEDEFFVVVPSIDVQYQTFDFMRLSAGIGYRFINGIDLKGIKDSDLNGLNLKLSFMFGNYIED